MSTCIGGQIFLQQTCVLIPALNEAACVAATVESWLSLGARRVRVVDNASQDDTALIARKAGAEVIHESYRGYGAAAWTGLQRWPSDAKWVLFSSADGSDRISLSELPAWQQALDRGANLVVGDRTQIKSSRAHLKPTQLFGNWLMCQGIRLGWGRHFRDLGSLRFVRHRDLMRLKLEDRGFGWNIEMQVRAIEHGWRIIEIPVQYFPRYAGESKISGSLSGTVRAGLGMARMLRKLWTLSKQRPQIRPAYAELT